MSTVKLWAEVVEITEAKAKLEELIEVSVIVEEEPRLVPFQAQPQVQHMSAQYYHLELRSNN